ncbi:PREDICTED: F-box/FBD/LRR-repeat protein At5g56420-like isoform X2 [Camelina sativa]|uniref:F-box/FBD/LRR-repeat protein At5g56420-like isoform X2 n=1 Tax=Camelina sativa TaxID=90675 RepID=A0ABM1QM28_CAMSA|nr:PREDICTED: F-box/FBD/LRR-repeat protein At5g56420-like isoform X2 [Camelina sativa]
MDKISQLSDDLLIKILSLLQTKDAVAMSILSKRWKSLWTLVPTLIFGEYPEDREDEDKVPKTNDESHCINMSQFVYGTLLLHKAPVLECFHLNRASGCSPSEIDLWIRIAVERFVRDLTIGFCYEYGVIRLPSMLFSCETLVTLELKKVIFLEVPSQIRFQSLKTLRLLFVKYVDEESFVRLISNSPVLEDLVVETCHDDNVVTFTINVPSLVSFSIRNTLQDLETENDLFVVHYHCLKQFTIVDYFGELTLIGNMPKLVEASLLSVSCQAKSEKFLRSITSIQHLSLCSKTSKITYPSGGGTSFFYLEHLELCTCSQEWSNLLNIILKDAPRLQVLKLKLKHCVQYSTDSMDHWTELSSVPKSLSSHLEIFEWGHYKGTKQDKKVAKYILTNASNLKMAIFSSVSVGRNRICNELENVARGSEACQLVFK